MIVSAADFAEQQAANEALRAVGRAMGVPGAVAPARIRAARRRAVCVHVGAEDVAGSDWGGPVRLRRHPNTSASALYLHVHGGGFVFGSPEEVDGPLAAIAHEANVEIYSVDYRLAPEHPFPAGRDDVGAALHWTLDEARRRGMRGVVVGGESAGANLALGAVLNAGTESLVARGLLACNLSFGFYDLGLSASARAWGQAYLALSTPWLRWFADCYLPDVAPDDRSASAASLLSAGLHALRGLPACLIVVGTADPLVDDSLRLHDRLVEAGVDSTIHVAPEAPHGFIAMPTAIGRTAMALITRWLSAHAAGTPPS